MALIEGQDLKKNILSNASPTTYSNRCSSLTPASVRYLQDIGVWDLIDATRIQPYHEMQVWDGVTDARISFDSMQAASSSSGPVACMIENVNLTTALQKRLSALGRADIFSPARVESISYGMESAAADLSMWPVVKLNNGRSLSARLLVGADGANSPVRTFANIQSRGWDYERHGIVATLQLSSEGRRGLDHKVAYQRFLPSGPVALLPLPGNMASLVWSTLPERAARLKALSPANFVAMVNAAFRLSPVDLTYLHTITDGQVDEVAWRRQHVQVNEEILPVEVVGVQDGSVAPFPLKMRHADAYTTERIALVG